MGFGLSGNSDIVRLFDSNGSLVDIVEYDDNAPWTVTAVGNGIAIPHANVTNIDKPYVFVSTLVNGLDFNSADDLPVDIIFLLIAPDGKGSEHLQALALVSRLLRNKDLTTKLRGCKSSESALAVISQSIREEAA